MIYKHKEFIIERKISSLNNDEQLNEGFKEIIMSIALLANISLSNQNKAMASEFIENNPDKIENFISDEDNVSKASNILDIPEEKIKDFKKDLSEVEESEETGEINWIEDDMENIGKEDVTSISNSNFLKLANYYNVNNPKLENMKGKKIYLFEYKGGQNNGEEIHQKDNVEYTFDVEKIVETDRFIYLLSSNGYDQPYLKITKKTHNLQFFKNNRVKVEDVNNFAIKQFFTNLNLDV